VDNLYDYAFRKQANKKLLFLHGRIKTEKWRKVWDRVWYPKELVPLSAGGMVPVRDF
jgi:hypothetical protein